MLKSAYETLSYASEILVFIFLGLGLFAFDHPYAKMGPMLLLVAFVAIGVGRFVNVYGISALVNRFSRNHRINKKYKVYTIHFSVLILQQ